VNTPLKLGSTEPIAEILQPPILLELWGKKNDPVIVTEFAWEWIICDHPSNHRIPFERYKANHMPSRSFDTETIGIEIPLGVLHTERGLEGLRTPPDR
jgi:hypothetical protein